ncbi:unnamed protein product [Hermetia illucens]|uniref:Uncharacterized protein n=1 Tax=Hermetia illucens TaxID=343691 RepID=A0A7R8UT70_HERIL|nr:uncharacterized protein LOC119651892 [Hermetia illucens]CAD7086083.1 unnamed protein product [Hermetia illucens]
MEADLGIIELEEGETAAGEINAPPNTADNDNTENAGTSPEMATEDSPRRGEIGDASASGGPNAAQNIIGGEVPVPMDHASMPIGRSSTPADTNLIAGGEGLVSLGETGEGLEGSGTGRPDTSALPRGPSTVPGGTSTATEGMMVAPGGSSAALLGEYAASGEGTIQGGRPISESTGEIHREVIPESARPGDTDGVQDNSKATRGIRKSLGDFKMPLGHGPKMPEGFKMPAGRGFKLPKGHGFKMPDGHGLKSPTGHGLKMPTGRGFKFSAGGRKRDKRSKLPGQKGTNGDRNEDEISYSSDDLYDSEYDVDEDESFLGTFDSGFNDFPEKFAEMIISPQKTLSENFETIVLKIETQNNVINSLKDKIKEKAKKFPRTMLEDNEIHNLNVCIQEEQKKLYVIQRAALQLQEKDPSRKWPPLRLATTYIEDCMPINVNFCRPVEECLPDKYPLTNVQNYLPRQGGRSSEEITSKKSTHSDLFGGLDPENRRGFKIIRRSRDPLFQQLLPENRRGYSLDPKKRLRPHYVKGDLVGGSPPKLSKTTKREMVNRIQGKIDGIQKELHSLECMNSSSDYSKKRKSSCKDASKRTMSARRCVEDIANAISRIQSVLEGNCDEKLGEERDTMSTHSDAELNCPYCLRKCKCMLEKDNCSDRDPDKYQLKKMYCELLEKYDQREREITRLKATVRTLNNEKEATKRDTLSNAQRGEIHLLRDKLQQYQVNCDDLKVMICEQARQIDDYRVKYMATLQKVEEQNCMLQKMEINNRRIEDQINLEIQQIKDRFQDKLNQYIHLPQLLENEQIKLAACCRQKDDLEMKLRIVCREYRALKVLYKKASQREDPERNKKLNDELANLRQQFALLTECKDRLSKENEDTRNELDTLRAESARIIVRLKERVSSSQANLERHVDELEKELAKCRAAACLSIADRDCVIKDMQAQLNCLSLSFDSSQKQIKTLKDHIAYLSHGKTESVVICCQPDGDK